MQMGGAYFVGCLKKIQRFFYIDTFQIVISIYKRIVMIFFRKIYGREINGINQGSYLKQVVWYWALLCKHRPRFSSGSYRVVT